MFFLRSGNAFVRFLVVFMAGIATAVLTELRISLWLMSSSTACYLIVYYFEKRYRTLAEVKATAAWTVLFFSGVVLVNERTEKYSPDHFTQFDSIAYYQARVVGQPEFTLENVKLVVEIIRLKNNAQHWIPASGKIITYSRKDSSIAVGKGDVLLIRGTPAAPPGPLNPGQFDYGAYLCRQNIYGVHFLNAGNFLKIGHTEDPAIIRMADGFRRFCEEKIRIGIPDDNEYYLTVALLLGVKAGLDEKLYQAYSETGTVHALAVSGLHVSLIYFIVIVAFGFLKKLPYGKILFAVIAVLIFWFYAMVTGFSPSVVRAVTMFSIVLMAGILRRNTGIYNTLAFSAFLILCVEPFWLMDIGFQFSFLAVVGIAYIYPIMYEWCTFKNYVLDKTWSLICLSLAAQLAVSPLSIYYFHSFPLLFLPFNLVIVPLSSLALYTGISGLILYKVPFVFDLCMVLTRYTVWCMNYLVQLPAGSDFLKIDFLYLSIAELLLCYLCVIFFFFSLKNRTYRSVQLAIVCLFFLSVSVLVNSRENFRKNTFTVYNVKGRTVFSFIRKGKAVVLSDSCLAKNDKAFRYALYNHLAKERISCLTFQSFTDPAGMPIKQCPFGQMIVWQGIKIARISVNTDQDFSHPVWASIDYLIISDLDFLRHLQRSKKKLACKAILIDSGIKEKSSQMRKDFYYVSKEGAFVCSR